MKMRRRAVERWGWQATIHGVGFHSSTQRNIGTFERDPQRASSRKVAGKRRCSGRPKYPPTSRLTSRGWDPTVGDGFEPCLDCRIVHVCKAFASLFSFSLLDSEFQRQSQRQLDAIQRAEYPLVQRPERPRDQGCGFTGLVP